MSSLVTHINVVVSTHSKFYWGIVLLEEGFINNTFQVLLGNCTARRRFHKHPLYN